MPAANFPDDQNDLKRLQNEWRQDTNLREKKIRANIVDNSTEVYPTRKSDMSDENTAQPSNTNDGNFELKPVNKATQPFDMTEWYLKYKKEEEEREMSAKQIVRMFVEDMKAAGATGKASISFSGSGDSGDFDRAEITDEQKMIMEKLQYYFEYPSTKWVDGKWIDERPDRKCLLQHLADLVPFDWVNNEGGYGEYTFDFDSAQVCLESHMRVERTEDYEDTF